MIQASHDLQLNTGMLLAVPIPAAYAAEGAVIQQAIEQSLSEAEQGGIAGAEVGCVVVNCCINLTSCVCDPRCTDSMLRYQLSILKM